MALFSSVCDVSLLLQFVYDCCCMSDEVSFSMEGVVDLDMDSGREEGAPGHHARQVHTGKSHPISFHKAMKIE